MIFRHWSASTLTICFGLVAAFAQPVVNSQTTPPVQFVTAEELKTKLAKNEPVTVIDVRASSALADSENKIKGSIHVKLRKLQARLALPPLKNIPRDSEVVTYCACPNDESAIRAAQELMTAGFRRVRALKGGWVAWKRTGGQVEARPRGL
ncbi:MAG: rhodanese-like domain-containing protein [Pyrinomonadaceae bacterium]